MKLKNLFIGATLAMTAGVSMSAGLALPGDKIITTDLCPVLGEAATLSVSKNVETAYSCDETTNTIRYQTCHPGGSRTPLVVQCVALPTNPVTFSPSGCADANPGTTVTISNYRGFPVSNKGGTIVPVDLGGACSQASVSALQ